LPRDGLPSLGVHTAGAPTKRLTRAAAIFFVGKHSWLELKMQNNDFSVLGIMGKEAVEKHLKESNLSQNEDLIKRLEEVLAQAKRGELHSILIVDTETDRSKGRMWVKVVDTVCVVDFHEVCGAFNMWREQYVADLIDPIMRNQTDKNAN
jgi:hypothetical protein